MWAFKNILSDNIVSKKSYTQNQLVFFGNTELDERGEKAFEIVSKINESIQLEYNPLEFSFTMNSKIVPYRDFMKYIKSIDTNSILIEATTLSFAEILYILDAANQNDTVRKIQILYIEPKEYKFHNSSVTTSRLFHAKE